MRVFEGQVAVVTGASSGIGKAIALALLAEGATVCLIGRKLETLKLVAKDTLVDASRIFSYSVDLLVDADIQNLISVLKSEFKQINILIHSAGIVSISRLETSTVEDFDKQFQVNVRAPYLLTQSLLPLIKRCQGQIVFINSSVVFNSRPGVGQYAATKHALRAIADSLRMEVNSDNVRVLSVYPGRTKSPMQEKLSLVEGRPYNSEKLIRPEDIAIVVLNALNLSSTAEITDIKIKAPKNRKAES